MLSFMDADARASAETLPSACTLGPDDGAARLRRWAALIEKWPPSSRREGRMLEIRWQPDPGVRDELEALADAERECCSFASWVVSTDGGEIVLRVAADPASPGDIAPIAAIFPAA
jgi:hypothetical protein